MGDEMERPRYKWYHTILGDMLAGMVPPRFRYHTLRQPSDVIPIGSGSDAVHRLANRTAWRANWALENFSFWATQSVGALSGLAGSASGIAQASRALAAMRAARPAMIRVGLAAKSMMGVPSETSTARTLMKMRDEAVSIAERIAAEDAARNIPMTKQEFGNVVDALHKSLAAQGMEDGILPPNLGIGPPPSPITNRPVPQRRFLDFWLPDGEGNATGFDTTTATVKSVADHESYIGMTNPDGTVVKDVYPLVYPPRQSMMQPFVRQPTTFVRGSPTGAVPTRYTHSRPPVSSVRLPTPQAGLGTIRAAVRTFAPIAGTAFASAIQAGLAAGAHARVETGTRSNPPAPWAAVQRSVELLPGERPNLGHFRLREPSWFGSRPVPHQLQPDLHLRLRAPAERVRSQFPSPTLGRFTLRPPVRPMFGR